MHELKDQIIKSLQNLRKQKMEIIKDIIKKKTDEQEKMKIIYKNNVIKDQINPNLAVLQKNLETSILTFRNTQMPKRKPVTPNYTLSFNNLLTSSPKPVTCAKKKSAKFNQVLEVQNNLKIDHETLLSSRTLVNEKLKTSGDLFNVKSFAFNAKKSLLFDDLNSSRDIDTISNNSLVIGKLNLTERKNTKRLKTKQTKSKATDNSTRPITRILAGRFSSSFKKSSLDINSTIETNKSTYRNTQTNTITIENSTLRESNSYIPHNTNLVDIRMVNKIKNSKSIQKVIALRNINSKSDFNLKKSIHNWKTSKKIKGYYFNSGNFNIPLFSKFNTINN